MHKLSAQADEHVQRRGNLKADPTRNCRRFARTIGSNFAWQETQRNAETVSFLKQCRKDSEGQNRKERWCSGEQRRCFKREREGKAVLYGTARSIRACSVLDIRREQRGQIVTGCWKTASGSADRACPARQAVRRLPRPSEPTCSQSHI